MGKPQSTERDPDDDVEPRGYDAGDATQVKERTVNAKNADRERIQGFGQLLQTKQGRSWTWWLLGQCGCFQSSFTGNSATFFKEGRRSIGLEILADFTKHFPDAYMAMTKENAHG